MKKICFITSVSSTAKAFILDFVKYMSKNSDFDITIICSYDNVFADSLPEYVNYIPINMERGIHLSGIKAIIKLIRVFKKNKFDIVQYSTPNASFYASIAAKLSKIKVRLYCQWGIVYVGYTGFKKWLFKNAEKIICKFSTIIEPDSLGNLEFSISQNLYNASKSRVVWNGSASGVNFSRFDIKNKEAWKNDIFNKFNIPQNTFVYGFVGRINKDKGINELIYAFKKIIEDSKDSILFVVGGQDSIKGIDLELLNWAKTNTNVIFCGSVSNVEKYYSAMDVFILPSYREGFGSVIIEAQAMGVPVITTNIPGPKDAIVDCHTGYLVEKGNSFDLYSKMLLMYKNEENLTMGLKGRKHVENNFDQIQLFRHILDDRNLLMNNKNGK